MDCRRAFPNALTMAIGVLCLGLATAGRAQEFSGEGDQVLAWVANQAILASEVLPRIDAIMDENREKIPETIWDRQRLQLVQQALKSAVENKLVLVDALRKIPAAGHAEIEKKVNEQFESDQIKRLMKTANVNSRAELEAKLASEGSTLELQRRAYFERSIATQWVRQIVQVDKKVSHDEMVAYYQEHLKDFEQPAKVRWEQLSADFDRFPSKQEAWAALAKMGNDVMRGAPWAQVARAGSHGSTAAEGGLRNWTNKGSLASTVLDEALFALPVGAMSPILVDDRSFHIVRVIERVEESRAPFRDAQVQISEEIQKQRRTRLLDEYYERLRKEIRVWTIFDDRESAERFASALEKMPPFVGTRPTRR